MSTWNDFSAESIWTAQLISIRHVRTREQLADILTKGAFATVQWKSVLRLFDIHPPSHLNVDRSFSASSGSAVSPQTTHAIPDVHKTQCDFEKGSWKQKLQNSSAGVENCSAWGNPNARNKLFHHWRCEKNPNGKTQCVLRNRKTENPTLFLAGSFVETQEGNNSLRHHSLQKRTMMSTEMEKKNPDAKFTLKNVVRSLMTLTAEGNLLHEGHNVESLKNRTRAVASPIGSLLSNVHKATS